MSLLENFDAVIFDLDGTLYDNTGIAKKTDKRKTFFDVYNAGRSQNTKIFVWKIF